MGNTSTASSNMRDAASEAREGVRDMGRAASAASGDLQKDLQMLREDFSRLAQQMADIVANRGTAAWQRARSGVDDVMSDAQDKSREAVDAMREVSDKFVEAVDEFDQESSVYDAGDGDWTGFPVRRDVATLGRGDDRTWRY